MNRKNPLPYLFLLGAILLLLSIPLSFSKSIRGSTIALFSPLWESLTNFKQWGKNLDHENKLKQEIERLDLEKQLLQTENNDLRERLQYQTKQDKLVPAKIIFRPPDSWYSSLWVNVGQADNEKRGNQIIAKNSPVLVGSSLVGVIDYVGTHQSRVKLITDSGLTPSVRTVRGAEQNKPLIEAIDQLLYILDGYQYYYGNAEEKEFLKRELEDLRTKSIPKGQTLYLAKGELHGSSEPLWRTNGHILQGIGFNYDFADEKGPARDLRTGKPFEKKGAAIPLLKVNDLLVTTGMDGVFPEGLNVAIVTKIRPLKEGDYYYELEAIPTAGSLEEISVVYILPPTGYDPSNQPPLIGR